MKRLVLTGIAAFAFALGAFAQGSINLDNSSLNNGVAFDKAGNWYSGVYGLEVYELSGVTAVPAGINVAAGPGSGVAAYNALVGAGFKLEKTLAGTITVANQGVISLGEVDMPDVTPAGSKVVVGLAMWNTSAASFSAMLGSSDANTRAGVIAFVNSTCRLQRAAGSHAAGHYWLERRWQ